MFKITIRKLNKSGVMPNQKGSSLIEVLIAVVLSAIIVTGIIYAERSTTIEYVNTSTHEVAKDIAASDMDYIFSQNYGSTYNLPSSPAEYSNYTTSPPIVTSIQKNEQQITINILLNNKTIYTLNDYRTNY